VRPLCLRHRFAQNGAALNSLESHRPQLLHFASSLPQVAVGLVPVAAGVCRAIRVRILVILRQREYGSRAWRCGQRRSAAYCTSE